MSHDHDIVHTQLYNYLKFGEHWIQFYILYDLKLFRLKIFMDFTGQRMATKSDHKNLVHKNLFLSTINFGKTAIKNFRLYICLYTSASPMKAATSLAGTARTNSQSCDSFFLQVDTVDTSTFAIEKQLALKPQM